MHGPASWGSHRAGAAALRLLVAVAAALLAVSPAIADSWSPPEPRVYHSADRRFRLTVTPRDISADPLYSEAGGESRAAPGRPAAGPDAPRGRLEWRRPGRRWTPVWDRPLVNEVSPVSAIVAPGGRYVVTFDNWGSLGTGGDVVVIYDAQGAPVRSLGLSDFLPEDYIDALPRSISSIWWGRDHRFSGDGKRLVLGVGIPGEDSVLNLGPLVEVQVDLASGRPIPPAGAGWQRVLAAASKVAAARRAAEKARMAAFAAPLLGPTSGREAHWHNYLREAFYRVDPDWRERSPKTTVLRAPYADDYPQSVPRVSRALLDDLDPDLDALMFASPAQDDLATVLIEALRRLPPGALKGIRVYVAVGDEYRGRLAEALAPTGAHFVQLDPALPIPQRPERLAQVQPEKAD